MYVYTKVSEYQAWNYFDAVKDAHPLYSLLDNIRISFLPQGCVFYTKVRSHGFDHYDLAL